MKPQSDPTRLLALIALGLLSLFLLLGLGALTLLETSDAAESPGPILARLGLVVLAFAAGTVAFVLGGIELSNRVEGMCNEPTGATDGSAASAPQTPPGYGSRHRPLFAIGCGIFAAISGLVVASLIAFLLMDIPMTIAGPVLHPLAAGRGATSSQVAQFGYVLEAGAVLAYAARRTVRVSAAIGLWPALAVGRIIAVIGVVVSLPAAWWVASAVHSWAVAVGCLLLPIALAGGAIWRIDRPWARSQAWLGLGIIAAAVLPTLILALLPQAR